MRPKERKAVEEFSKKNSTQMDADQTRNKHGGGD